MQFITVSYNIVIIIHHSGVIGSGMCVFSKHSIVEVAMKRFSLNGMPHYLTHGDWLGGKAVGLCRIQLSNSNNIIDFYQTHLHACYATSVDKDEYMAHRVAQAWEVAQFIKSTAKHNVIIAGDFNVSPDTLPYSLVSVPA